MLGIIETSIGYVCNTLLYRCPRENCSIVHQPRTFTDPSQTPTTHVHRPLTNNNHTRSPIPHKITTTHVHRILTNNNHTCSTIPHEHQPHMFTNPSRTPTTHFHRFLTNTNHTRSPIPHEHQPHIGKESCYNYGKQQIVTWDSRQNTYISLVYSNEFSVCI